LKFREKLKVLLTELAISKGDFTLSSGWKTDVYLDAKKVTLHPVGNLLIGKIFIDEIKHIQSTIEFIGGPELGAIPISLSVAVNSFYSFPALLPFVVRKEQKQHGTQQLIEGHIPTTNSRVVLVDDVATTGSSLVHTIEVLKDTGCHIVQVIVLVDRQQGAKENLIDNHEVELVSIFTLDELFRFAESRFVESRFAGIGAGEIKVCENSN